MSAQHKNDTQLLRAIFFNVGYIKQKIKTNHPSSVHICTYD